MPSASAIRFCRKQFWNAVFVLVAACWSPTFADDAPASRWESDMRKFEELDRASSPEQDGVVFLGSSSIRLWKLDESFPGEKEKFVNRGFGGSQLSDSVHFAERILAPHRPRVVVVYAGDNDIAADKSPEQVANDFKALTKTIHARLPTTAVIYISIKPSIARWKLVEKVRDRKSVV